MTPFNSPENLHEASQPQARGVPEVERILLVDPIADRRQALLCVLRQHGFSARGVGTLPGRPRVALVLVHVGALSLSDATVAQFAALRAGYDVPLALVSDAGNLGMEAQAIGRGLRGLIATTLPPAMIAAAVELILAGGVFVSRHCWREMAKTQPLRHPEPDGSAALTSREEDVLHALLDGKPNKIIAHGLGISESTVKVHLRSIMRKLKVSNRTQIVCLSRGWLLPRIAVLPPAARRDEPPLVASGIVVEIRSP